MRFIFIALLAFITLNAAQLKNSDETLQLADNIMINFVKADFHNGLALAKPYWPLPESEIDGLETKIKDQWPIVERRYGKSTGWEFIKEERIGQSFVRYYYLHKFQHHVIYWRITFYKPIRHWVVNGITFKDDVDILFETTKTFK